MAGPLRVTGFLIVLMILIGTASCDSHRYYEENKKIAGGHWSFNNSLSFPVVITDTAALYNFYVNVRNDVNYPYSNLYLFLKTTFPDGKTAQDTLECQLAALDGRWLGSGMGSVRFNRFLFQPGVRFAHPGTYTFTFEQAMRTQDLKGIRDIGLRIEKE
jgi:gliding motility-associated lipoprotein GldH